jgi:lysophospholipase L1-like esterase
VKKRRKKILAGFLLLMVSTLVLGNLYADAAKSEKRHKNLITIYLAGDSTVSDYDGKAAPRAGWGQVLGGFFDDKVIVENEASSGRSSKSFIDEGRLDAILKQIEKGDYLFIQFGHNDQKIEDPSRYTEPYTTYKSHLKQYIDGARAKKAVPVLITPVERRRFTAEGIARDSHGEYPKAMMELAEEENVPLIDLTAKSKALFQELGPEGTKDVFLWLEEGEHVNYPQGMEDNTHFQEDGAGRIAGLVIEEMRELKLVPLRTHILK